jgi:DNA-binding NarL/FixJ family response regulator
MFERHNSPSFSHPVRRDSAEPHAGRALQLDAPARVLLADDHTSLLTALSRLLEWSYSVVGTVATGAQALEAAGRLQPDVIVVDMRLPDMDGLRVCRQVGVVAPHAQVIVLTAADDPVIKQRALELGASAFVVKYRAGDDLIPAIDGALAMRASKYGRRFPRYFSGHPLTEFSPGPHDTSTTMSVPARKP